MSTAESNQIKNDKKRTNKTKYLDKLILIDRKYDKNNADKLTDEIKKHYRDFVSVNKKFRPNDKLDDVEVRAEVETVNSNDQYVVKFKYVHRNSCILFDEKKLKDFSLRLLADSPVEPVERPVEPESDSDSEEADTEEAPIKEREDNLSIEADKIGPVELVKPVEQVEPPPVIKPLGIKKETYQHNQPIMEKPDISVSGDDVNHALDNLTDNELQHYEYLLYRAVHEEEQRASKPRNTAANGTNDSNDANDANGTSSTNAADSTNDADSGFINSSLVTGFFIGSLVMRALTRMEFGV